MNIENWAIIARLQLLSESSPITLRIVSYVVMLTVLM